jgi:hypothetical protein
LTPAPLASQSPEAVLTRQDSRLAERLAPADCVAWREDDALTGPGLKAAVRCQPGDGAAAEVALAAFSDQDALKDAWSTHLASLDPSLEDLSSACQGSTTGVRRWGFGSVACQVDQDAAIVSWTDSRSGLLGIARGSGPDLAAIFSWWQDSGKALGRAPVDTSSSPPDDGRPFVRVPGAPNDAICSNLDEPIVDVQGRTWHLKQVRFQNGPDYERVVLALERAGRARQGQTTGVTVERVSVSALASEFPGAPRPKDGRTALVVRMRGVTQAPDLRGYRPDGLTLVQELSIVRGERTRTALIALDGDGCYQVRVPVFGASAPAGAERAEIYIDIPR